MRDYVEIGLTAFVLIALVAMVCVPTALIFGVWNTAIFGGIALSVLSITYAVVGKIERSV